ncbi:MAG: hypothetical protein IKD22_04090, partial [Lentisphaeria bacterium]|nr:hypothetical protein [Lentisphaeria bacterium]
MEKIVAAEIGAGGLELFCRTGDGATVKTVQNFAPWCLAPAGVEPPQGVEMKVLAGGGKFNCRWEFPSVTEYEKCESDLKKNPELMLLRDMVQQGLSATGLRLFNNLLTKSIYNEVRCNIRKVCRKSISCSLLPHYRTTILSSLPVDT